jgi:hypothetical protein
MLDQLSLIGGSSLSGDAARKNENATTAAAEIDWQALIASHPVGSATVIARLGRCECLLEISV